MVCKFVLGRVRKSAKGDYKLRNVCPSARPYAIILLALDEFFMKFDI